MTRFHGPIGYADRTEETSPGVFEEILVEYTYFGDLIRNARRVQEDPTKVNDDILVVNTISVVADAYAREHFFNIRYIGWQGKLWIPHEVEVQLPRLLLRVGGLYNGPTA